MHLDIKSYLIGLGAAVVVRFSLDMALLVMRLRREAMEKEFK